MKKIKVLLADDHQLFRKPLRMLLEMEENIEIVGETDDGADAVKLAKKLKPDVVIMDIQLPSIDGIQATRQIIQALTHTKVIILSMYDDEHNILKAVQAGAKGYVVKSCAPDELVKVIKLIAAGEVCMPRSLTTKLLKAVEKLEPITQLTPREIEILELAKQGLINKEIAAQLHTTEKTVRNIFNNILQKLDAANRTQAVVKAIQSGIISSNN
ncbi:MAG: response regulator transcription factor [Elusimicrobiota bacterium]